MPIGILCAGLHRFANVDDAIGVFGHAADYVICPRRALVAHTENVGISMVVRVEILRTCENSPKWNEIPGSQTQGAKSRWSDCIWDLEGSTCLPRVVEELFDTWKGAWKPGACMVSWT